MSKTRMEAFSDGVIAIIITIMVLELKLPHSAELAVLKDVFPLFLTYALSFVFLGIYWNNHHHLVHMTTRINGRILWANLHLLFWLSLIPTTTAWVGETHFATLPVAIYGGLLLMAGVGYLILQLSIIAHQGPDSKLKEALGKDVKGPASAVLYAAGAGLAFVEPKISLALYVLVALIWLVPDRRLEKHLANEVS